MSPLNVIFPSKFPRFLVLAALLAGLAGCGGPAEVARPEPPPPDPAASADRLLEQGNYAGAATAYVALAGDGTAPGAARYTALAALAYQEAGDAAKAAALLGPEAGPSASPLHALARARALLGQDRAKDAYALASAIPPDSLTPYLRGVQARVSGAAALAQGDFAAASSWWVSAFEYPYPPTAAPTMVEATWRAVARLPERELAKRAAATDALTSGWYQLGLINARALLDQTTFAAQTAAWQQRFPTHPAASLLTQLAERAVAAAARPRRIALLLPFDATLGVAAAAVRDGFLTAWYKDTHVQDRPAVMVYSSASGKIAEDYARAVAAGAEFVVGPLRKHLVEQLKSAPELPVGLLALNVIDPKPGATPPPPGFYQFGLTPEDEAMQVARHAQARGNRALVMAPNSAWGRRVQAAYSTAWRGQGGIVLAELSYSEAADAYAAAVRRALNIDISEARAAALQRRLGVPLRSEPRVRADVDAILLAAFPDNARQILPQLRFFGAEAIPVFATSHVYAGTLDAGRDIDLDGLVFGDMPWLFGGADVDSFNLVRRSWPAQAGSFARLYAFGIDAYRVLPYLAKLRQQQSMRVPGVTGDLWMDQDGVLHRNMTWMKFVNGIPTFTEEALAGRRP